MNNTLPTIPTIPRELYPQIFRYSFNPKVSESSRLFRQSFTAANPLQTQELNKIYPNWQINPNLYLFDISKKGDKDLLAYIIKYRNPRSYIMYDYIAAGAARGGYRDILYRAVRKKENEFMSIKEKVTFNNLIASEAASGGYLDIVKYAVSKGATNFSQIARNAARYGQFNIVEYAVNNTRNNGMEKLENPHLIYLNIHLEEDLIDLANEIAKNAAEGGYIDIVKYAITLGATRFDIIARGAASEGHLNIVEYLVDKGATDLSGIALNASLKGHKDVVEYAVNTYFNPSRYQIKRSPNNIFDFNMIASESIRGNHPDTLKYLVSIGSTKGLIDYDYLSYIAKREELPDIIDWIGKYRLSH
jgi:hypothetical protein